MSILDVFKRKTKTPTQTRGFLIDHDFCEWLKSNGYVSLDRCPEVLAAVDIVADLVGSMTLYLMANTENGDKRIVNELSRAVDIYPNRYMTRKTWVTAIVRNMMLYGKGNAVVMPHTENGLLGDLEIIDPDRVTFKSTNNGGYKILIDRREYDPSELLHFVWKPKKHKPYMGEGITATLKEVADGLKQARTTKDGFMSSKYKPSLIVRVDGLAEGFGDKDGRDKLYSDYLETNEAGKPWIVPADLIDVKEVRPLSLSDLAINESMTLDKKTVASLVGVPAFLLGVGDFSTKEWDNFINTTVRFVAQILEQELTRKILISPKMYWRFNIASLYSYDLKSTAEVFRELYVRGIVTRDEVRDKIGMPPVEDTDALIILENFIPASMIGDQSKLQGDTNNG